MPHEAIYSVSKIVSWGFTLH